MIKLLLKYAANPTIGSELSVAMTNLIDSAGQGNADLVEMAELTVHADPAKAFSFDADGFATLRVGEHFGGGVFGNPIPLIWEAIRWAAAETKPLLSRDLDVIVNGRNLGNHMPRETILAGVREHGGALLTFSRTGLPEVR